ncbi:MAG: sorbosone dehydrogenase family protein, partial [Acidobacteriaceae bacterium]|nr:sorbosone dehydrogenase family protein [Acidobacteriaceae bacterium]
MNIPVRWLALAASIGFVTTPALLADSSDSNNVLTGTAAFTDYQKEKPGTFRKITVDDLPKPYATPGVGNPPTVEPRPANAWPQAPAGFKVQLFTNEGLTEPRKILTAPNGDIFVADTHGGKIVVFRGITSDGKPQQRSIFATGLKQPFGIAFYPVGKDPQWLYIGNTNSVVRFAYKNGDL